MRTVFKIDIISAGLTLVGFAYNDLFCTLRDFIIARYIGNVALMCTMTGKITCMDVHVPIDAHVLSYSFIKVWYLCILWSRSAF